MTLFACYWLWYAKNPGNTIEWDDEYIYIKARKAKKTVLRAEIQKIDLKLNNLTFIMNDGNKVEIDVTDMYVSYDEINRFRQANGL